MDGTTVSLPYFLDTGDIEPSSTCEIVVPCRHVRLGSNRRHDCIFSQCASVKASPLLTPNRLRGRLHPGAPGTPKIPRCSSNVFLPDKRVNSFFQIARRPAQTARHRPRRCRTRILARSRRSRSAVLDTTVLRARRAAIERDRVRAHATCSRRKRGILDRSPAPRPLSRIPILRPSRFPTSQHGQAGADISGVFPPGGDRRSPRSPHETDVEGSARYRMNLSRNRGFPSTPTFAFGFAMDDIAL